MQLKRCSCEILFFLFAGLSAGCVIPVGNFETYKGPVDENLDEIAVIHAYAPASSTDGFEGLEIRVDGKVGSELENGEVRLKVSPGHHTVTLGDYSVGGGGASFIIVISIGHNEVTKAVENHFYPGETYYFRLKRSPKWSDRLSYPDIQLTNKQIYDIEFSLFRGLKSYDELQKEYFEKSCMHDNPIPQTSNIDTPPNTCDSEFSSDFHIFALEEVHSNFYEWDLWDKALDDVEGDQNKQLARYIELRAAQLYDARTGEITGTSLYKQAMIKSDAGGLSGAYRASFTSNQAIKSPRVAFLTQIDNKVTGIFYPDKGDVINGVIEGNSIRFLWRQKDSENDIEGFWNISPDGSSLEGNWETNDTSNKNSIVEGKLTLTRIDKVATGKWNLSQSLDIYDLSGTYASEITGIKCCVDRGDLKTTLTITQKGNKITGTYGDHGELEGQVLDNIVRFKWYSSWTSGTGEWVINSDGDELTGALRASHYDHSGKWTLRRIE